MGKCKDYQDIFFLVIYYRHKNVVYISTYVIYDCMKKSFSIGSKTNSITFSQLNYAGKYPNVQKRVYINHRTHNFKSTVHNGNVVY